MRWRYSTKFEGMLLSLYGLLYIKKKNPSLKGFQKTKTHMSISYIFKWFWLFLLSLFNIKEFENKANKEFDDEKDLRVRKKSVQRFR